MHFSYRINNPGNLRPGKDVWQGQAGIYRSKVSGDFLKFKTMVDGIRAKARTIGNYPQQYKTDTMRKFFHVYAPVGDGSNNPDAYATTVAKAVGVGVDDPVDFTRYEIVRPMLPIIARVETGEDPGQYITAEQWDEGIFRAGNITGAPVPKGFVREEDGNVRREKIEDSKTIDTAKKGTKATIGISGAAAGAAAAANAAGGIDWKVLVTILVFAAVIAGVVYFTNRKIIQRRIDQWLGGRG